MSTIGGMNVLVMVFIMSFAIDRVVNGFLFLLAVTGIARSWLPDSSGTMSLEKRERALSMKKLWYFVFSAILSILVLSYFGDVRILVGLNMSTPPMMDVFVTGLTLVGGADFLGRLLQLSGAYGGASSANQPVEITGRLVLEPTSKSSGHASDDDVKAA